MALLQPSIGLMSSSDGETMILTTLKDIAELSSWITLLIICLSTHLLQAVYWALTLPIICTVVSVTGSSVQSSWCSKLWTRSWKPTQHCMSWEKESENAFNSILQSLLSPILTHRIMENFSRIKLSGSLMTLMSTELLFTRPLRVTWQRNLSTVPFSSLTQELDNYSWKSFTQVCGPVKSVLGSLPSGRLLKKLLL